MRSERPLLFAFILSSLARLSSFSIYCAQIKADGAIRRKHQRETAWENKRHQKKERGERKIELVGRRGAREVNRERKRIMRARRRKETDEWWRGKVQSKSSCLFWIVDGFSSMKWGHILMLFFQTQMGNHWSKTTENQPVHEQVQPNCDILFAVHLYVHKNTKPWISLCRSHLYSKKMGQFELFSLSFREKKSYWMCQKFIHQHF